MRTSGYLVLCAIAAAVLAGGCGQSELTCPRVIYLDGAGWFTGHSSVRKGLEDAGYPGAFERFHWSMGIAPLDHVSAGPGHPAAEALCQRIMDLRRASPGGQIVLVGLSSASAIIVGALEKLTPDVSVDYVVLLSPSLASRTDLREAMRHVMFEMYVTLSHRDMLLAMGDSSGPSAGEPAGRVGFQPPYDVACDDEGGALYSKVVHIPWKRAYAVYGWTGGHVSSTSSGFIHKVIAPRIMATLPAGSPYASRPRANSSLPTQ
ncbi:MAG TPA: hypothetical protein VNA25_19035 [Phycisphaerae bacterium]|nr:hypothetical protein [Phycisphaerae bacterium]HUT59944.1 hypothetical protein [Phycisphaerae bacterium]